jgi:hypothetical protein
MSLISYWDFSFFHQMAYYRSQACLQLLNNFQRTSPKEGTGSEQILKKCRSLFALIFPLHNGHILGNWLRQCGRFFCPFSGFLIKHKDTKDKVSPYSRVFLQNKKRIVIYYVKITVLFMSYSTLDEVSKLVPNLEYLFSFNFQLKNAETKFCFLGHLYAIKVP